MHPARRPRLNTEHGVQAHACSDSCRHHILINAHPRKKKQRIVPSQSLVFGSRRDPSPPGRKPCPSLYSRNTRLPRIHEPSKVKSEHTQYCTLRRIRGDVYGDPLESVLILTHNYETHDALYALSHNWSPVPKLSVADVVPRNYTHCYVQAHQIATP